jgi:hypothetical protein
MASSDSCLIHFDGKKGPLTSFSAVSYQKCLDCRRIWLTLDGEEHSVAQRIFQFVSDSMENSTVESIEYANSSYHRGCYSAFTNSRMIKRAQVRCQNMEKEGVPSSSGIDIIDEETESDETPPVKKMLRSTATLSSRTGAEAKSRNPHVLPCVCIICKSEKSYFTESVSLLIYFFTIYIVIFLICVV